MMKIVPWLVVLGVALAVLHRLALWAERRGWIFYKHRKASPGSVANGLLQVQALLEPGVRHVVESRLEDVSEENESGDPPSGEPPRSSG